MARDRNQSGGKSGIRKASDVGHGGCSAEVPPDRSELIGNALKSVYQQAVEEDVPDMFTDLLKRLD